MDKKILIGIFGIIALVVLLSGCTQQQNACGNAACDSGETIQSCPADCSSPEGPPMPQNPDSGNPPELPF